MEANLYFFTAEQGNMLVRLMIAYVLSEFLFQTKAMFENQNWFSKQAAIHLGILFLASTILSNWWIGAALITSIHFLIDILRIRLNRKYANHSLGIFIAAQWCHVLTIVIIWAGFYDVYVNLLNILKWPFLDYKISLILLGYSMVTVPVGHLIKYAIRNIPQVSDPVSTSSSNDMSDTHMQKERGGKSIGIFERIIILTFVLLGQYEAIGFLITGKSIIRFANKDEHIRSEYVLVGTMMSYSISIIIGVLINYMLAL